MQKLEDETTAPGPDPHNHQGKEAAMLETREEMPNRQSHERRGSMGGYGADTGLMMKIVPLSIQVGSIIRTRSHGDNPNGDDDDGSGNNDNGSNNDNGIVTKSDALLPFACASFVQYDVLALLVHPLLLHWQQQGQGNGGGAVARAAASARVDADDGNVDADILASRKNGAEKDRHANESKHGWKENDVVAQVWHIPHNGHSTEMEQRQRNHGLKDAKEEGVGGVPVLLATMKMNGDKLSEVRHGSFSFGTQPHDSHPPPGNSDSFTGQMSHGALLQTGDTISWSIRCDPDTKSLSVSTGLLTSSNPLRIRPFVSIWEWRNSIIGFTLSCEEQHDTATYLPSQLYFCNDGPEGRCVAHVHGAAGETRFRKVLYEVGVLGPSEVLEGEQRDHWRHGYAAAWNRCKIEESSPILVRPFSVSFPFVSGVSRCVDSCLFLLGRD